MANVSAFAGAFPVIPGGLVQVASVTRTSSYSVSATSVATAADVFSPSLTFVANGSDPYLIEFYCPHAASATTLNANANAWLTTGGSSDIGAIAVVGWGNGSAPIRCPVQTQYVYTPAAGLVTLNVRVTYGTATTTWFGGSGGGGSTMPMMLRASRIVNQNDGLKPFWTPPIVTQLPSQATVGDQVLYAADATNGVYWHLQYDGLGTYPWKFIGGSPLTASAVGTYSSPATGSTSNYVNSGLSGSPTITAPLAGDYITRVNANAKTSNSSPAPGVFISYASAVPGSWDGSDSLASGGAASSYVLGAQKRGTVTAASQAIALVWTNANLSGTVSFYSIYMSATPIRVKAP